MDIIKIIFVERLLFDSEVKESLERSFKRSGIKFTYYDGYILRFEKTNVYSITPHRLVFSKNEYNLLVLYYDEYHETDELFFVDGEKYTLQGIKRYVRNYFLSKTSNKPTKDSTKNNTKRPKIGLKMKWGLGIKKLVLLHTRSITYGANEGNVPKHFYTDI